MTGHKFPATTVDDVALIDGISQGRTYAEMGLVLGLTAAAARKRTVHLQDRLGAINPASLVRRAYELRILKVGYP